MARRIIIDTDPGHDDAFAILMALAAPELAVLGLSVVAGNVPLPLTSSNARRILELAGRPEVPVFEGCPRPLVGTLFTAENIHGRTGLDGPDLPAPRLAAQPRHAVDWLVDTLLAAGDGEITLCVLGPMTNVAMAMVKDPRILPKLREVVMMGGGFFEGGNVRPAAEFNIYVDPHAASVVLSSGVPLTLVPLDCTHKALMPAGWKEDLRRLGTAVGRAAAELIDFFEAFGNAKYGTETRPLHDACVVGWLLRPDLFDGRVCAVEVATDRGPAYGMTVVDWWHVTPAPRTVRVLNQIDRDGFYALALDLLSRYRG